MTQIEFVKCGINGEGIGYIDRKPVFCDGVFPGETAEVEIIEEKPTYMRAKLKRIIAKAPCRFQNPCSHAPQCGACPQAANG
ncbi:MAG: TRAM domain-containing protein [Galactobacillus timonensis]|nr:TRAM domain-containing protein [Galactobacillus timonensis]